MDPFSTPPLDPLIFEDDSDFDADEDFEDQSGTPAGMSTDSGHFQAPIANMSSGSNNHSMGMPLMGPTPASINLGMSSQNYGNGINSGFGVFAVTVPPPGPTSSMIQQSNNNVGSFGMFDLTRSLNSLTTPISFSSALNGTPLLTSTGPTSAATMLNNSYISFIVTNIVTLLQGNQGLNPSIASPIPYPSTTGVDLTDFPRFGRLPTEMRQKIWKLVAREPRVIDLWPREVPGELGKRIRSGIFLKDHPILWRSYNAVPAMLHVDAEARCEGLKIYTVAFETDTVAPINRFPSYEMLQGVIGIRYEYLSVKSPGKIYVNFDVDIICPMRAGGDMRKSLAHRIHGTWDSAVASHPQIRRVALDGEQFTEVSDKLVHVARLDELIIYSFKQEHEGILRLGRDYRSRAIKLHFRERAGSTNSIDEAATLQKKRLDEMIERHFEKEVRMAEVNNDEKKGAKEGDEKDKKPVETWKHKTHGYHYCRSMIDRLPLPIGWKPPRITATNLIISQELIVRPKRRYKRRSKLAAVHPQTATDVEQAEEDGSGDGMNDDNDTDDEDDAA